MTKKSTNSAKLEDSVVNSLIEINTTLKQQGITPIAINNPIYGCGSCAMWSSGKGVCEGKAK